MAKERKPDLQSPEEAALEQHVHDMMDINAPDEPKVEASKEPVKKSKSIAITHADDAPVEAAKEEVNDAELAAAIDAANEQLAREVGTAPLVPSQKTKKAPIKLTVVHHDDEEAVPEESAETLAEPEKTEEPVSELKAVESEAQASEAIQEVDTSATVGELMERSSPLEPEIESEATNKAVSDIIAQEGDELLAVQDSAPLPDRTPNRPKKDSPSLLSLILRSPSFRWTLFAIIVIGLIFVGAYPKTRYLLLNKAGVKSTASVVITDQSTLRPLKNVKVSLAGQTVSSDENGKASLSNLALGPSEIVIEKRAYATERQKVTVGWGSNPLKDVTLKPQGVQYTFQVNDVFSGKPITEVEAAVGEFTATANEKGEIKLALDKVEADEVTVVFTAQDYRKQELKLKLSNKEPATVTMTPSRQVAFVSKRTGTYDVYKTDVDGKNESLVLKGSGKESNNITLIQHPTHSAAVLLSTRDGSYGADGTLKQALTYVNLKDSITKTVTSSSQLKPIEWIGTRLVYVMLDDSAAQDSTSRYKLMSYDFTSGDNRQLAAANYFNSVIPMSGKIFYAPSSAYQNGINNGVFAVHADGSGKDAILDKEAWNMFRTGHDTLAIAVQQEWYRLTAGKNEPEKLSGQPTDTTSRLYTDSPDSKYSIWIDNHDGKGTLMLYDQTKKSDNVVLSESGLRGPVRWINETTIVYRVSSAKETADYVLSVTGGTSHKIVDVTNSDGIEAWSY